MLEQLDAFRETLDDILTRSFHRRIAIYGRNYTSRFIRWYADYYHSLTVDFEISDEPLCGGYELEIFQKEVFEYSYRDLDDAVIWICVPLDEDLRRYLEKCGYKKNETYYDLFGLIYGEDTSWPSVAESEPCRRRKTGRRDIQFLEWLEWKYGCNFVSAVQVREFVSPSSHSQAYTVTTQKELFPILDKIHFHPSGKDAFFDFGSGKGGAIVSALDYGFQKVGGVEYEQGLYDVCLENFKLLGIPEELSQGIIQGDAGKMIEELDAYNYFFFSSPFDAELLYRCFVNIEESTKRKPRKVRLIVYRPTAHHRVAERGYFKLVNQFTIEDRNRVVHIYENS